MTSGTAVDYGSTFSKGGSPVVYCQVVDFPEISTDKVESTNHSSGGVREYLPSGLIGLGDITLSVISRTGTVPAMRSEMVAKTVSQCVITNPIMTMTFDGFYTSLKVEAADAQSPDTVKTTVVISPTGPITVT